MKSIVHGRPEIFPDKIGKRNHLALDNLPFLLHRCNRLYALHGNFRFPGNPDNIPLPLRGTERYYHRRTHNRHRKQLFRDTVLIRLIKLTARYIHNHIRVHVTHVFSH